MKDIDHFLFWHWYVENLIWMNVRTNLNPIQILCCLRRVASVESSCFCITPLFVMLQRLYLSQLAPFYFLISQVRSWATFHQITIRNLSRNLRVAANVPTFNTDDFSLIKFTWLFHFSLVTLINDSSFLCILISTVSAWPLLTVFSYRFFICIWDFIGRWPKNTEKSNMHPTKHVKRWISKLKNHLCFSLICFFSIDILVLDILMYTVVFWLSMDLLNRSWVQC